MTTVSVVVPAYNNEQYIAETLDSILAQTHRDLEIIVADHSSTDGTRKIIDGYAGDVRVTVLTTEAGGGARRNWNAASQAATGEYIKLVCGDDVLHPRLIERQLDVIGEDSAIALVACRRDLIDANSRPFIEGRGLAGIEGRIDGAAAVRRTVRAGTNLFGEPACTLMRREHLAAVGWWDDAFPYLIDEATYARVLLRGDFVGLPESLAGFRVSDAQWSVRLARQQAEQAAGFHRWIQNERPDLVSRTDVVIGDLRAAQMAILRRLAYFYLRNRMSRSEG
jgi:glycosyltransferase involved in cell wall biosynthesis